jgi:hypothetical protein
LFHVSAQILENRLLALLDFQKDWFGQSQIVCLRLNLASLQQYSPQVGNALLREQHLIVGLNYGNSNSSAAFSFLAGGVFPSRPATSRGG